MNHKSKLRPLGDDLYRLAQIPLRVTYAEKEIFIEKAKQFTQGNISEMVRAAVMAFQGIAPKKERK